jgi:DNA repair protein RadD
MILRPYQARVVEAIRSALNGGMMNPCATIPTGGGKTAVIMEMAHTFTTKGHRCLVLTHVAELIGQLAGTAVRCGMNPCVFAASLKRREYKGILVIGQIQTVYKTMHSLDAFSVVFVDESHLINPEGEGMYRTAIEALRSMNPKVRVIGLSATPFRMGSGLIYGPGQMFDDCVASVSMRELIDEGYLTPLVGKNADRAFNGDEDNEKVRTACRELVVQAADRRRWLIFGSSIAHAEMIVEELRALCISAEMISGTTPTAQRDDILARHRAGEFTALVNCAVLTTGYDDPQIDCVAILRPTRSPGLFLQMVGRGLRIHPSKASCLILDFGGCLEALGPIDTIEERVRERREAKGLAGSCPMKTCPDCSNVVFTGQKACSCGHEWPRNLNHEVQASTAQLFSGATEHAVQRASYSVNSAKPGKSECIRITYWDGPITQICNEFLFPDSQPATLLRGKLCRWVRDTPRKEVPGRVVAVEEGKVIGTHNEERTVLDSAMAMLPFMVCFQSPSRITTIPAQNPRYKNVIKREFKEIEK